MYNSQDIAQRIKNRAKQQKVSVNQLLLNCELGKNTVTKIASGTDILTLNFAKIADYLECSVDYLLGRTNIPEVNRTKTKEAAVQISPDEQPQKEMIHTDEEVTLKLVGKAAAGIPLEMVADDCDLLRIDRVSKSGIKLYPTDIVVKIQGDSMIDADIDDGDYALIRPCPVAENGQIALVAVGDGSTLKKFYRTADGVELHPCNSAHPIQTYKRPTDIRIIGTFICTCNGEIIEQY